MPIKGHTPHLRAEGSVPQMMWTGVLALLPAVIAALIFGGFPAFRVLTVAAAAAVLSEVGARTLFRRRVTLYDGSAVMTGFLLGLLLPTNLPSWSVALSASFALIFGKEIFGGLGQNPFNPALVGMAFLGASFPGARDLFLISGSGGAAKAQIAALLLGGALVLSKKLTHGETPFLYLGSLGAVSWILGFGGKEAVFSGVTLLAAFFLVTDPVTTPLTRLGTRWFAAGAGCLTAALRPGMSWTEGMTYGILFMNALNPWLDRQFRPRHR